MDPKPDFFKDQLPSPSHGIADYRIQVTLETARQSIEKCIPNFVINSLEDYCQGMANQLFIVNGEYIFRFSKHAKADKTLQRELVVLSQLRDHITTSIPNFEYSGEQDGNNLHFVGYRIIPGDELTSGTLNDADGHPDVYITAQIAQFFNELHSFNIDKAKSLSVPERKPKDFF